MQPGRMRGALNARKFHRYEARVMVRLKGENVPRSMRRVRLRKTYRVLRSTRCAALDLERCSAGDASRYFWGTHLVPVQSKHLVPVVLFEQRRSCLSIARPFRVSRVLFEQRYDHIRELSSHSGS